MQVSIHTPTKGVTCGCISVISAYGVSIHTPTKGVTSLQVVDDITGGSFNPHTHEGCDI